MNLMKLSPMKELALPSSLFSFERSDFSKEAHDRVFHFLCEAGFPNMALAMQSYHAINVSDMFFSMDSKSQSLILTKMVRKTPCIHSIMHKPALILRGHSNTSIIRDDGASLSYVLNARMVNYKLDEKAQFLLPSNAPYFQSSNKMLRLDIDLITVTEEKMFDTVPQTTRYRGIEDIRILSHNSLLWYIGTVCHDSKLMMTLQKYDVHERLLPIRPIASPYDRSMEKNWCMFSKGEDILIVYQWAPLEIGRIKNGRLEMIHRHDYGWHFMTRLKGSSVGVLDETTGMLWFLVHFHSDDIPRQYYHMFVCMDISTYDILEISSPFLFEQASIQFGMGLVVEKHRIIMTYTIFDTDARVASYDRKDVENMLFGKYSVYTTRR